MSTAREPRHHVLLSREIMEAVAEYRFDNRIETRTEAIEQLIRAGLDATKRKPARRREAA
jgi:hypothetical protein